VVGIADSRRHVLDPRGVDLDRWREVLAAADPSAPFGWPSGAPLLEELARQPGPVLVDVTAADGMEAVYPEAFARGVHVITANKRPLAAPVAGWERMTASRREHGRHFAYETTVGASLPLVSTLRDLVRGGDHVRRIEGSLSGTLGYAASELMKGSPLSLVVRWAKELGFSETDPRDDLSGLDAARKAVILARELGFAVDVADVEIEPFVPADALAGATPQELFAALRRLDEPFARRCRALADAGRVLRYLAWIDVDGGSVRLRVGPAEVERDHRAAGLRGVEAYVAFTTDRHRELPLVVQGAGVGGALTAGAIVADVFRIAPSHGAR
jgi:homoserine dehydrogenase